MKRKTKADKKLFRIVDKVLKQIFREFATLAMYKHLEEKYSLKRENIPSKPEVFAEGMEKYLNSGAFAVAEMVLNESSEPKLKKDEDEGFFQQLRELKRNFYR